MADRGLAVTGETNLAILLGNANGTFQPATYFGWNGAFLASGDLNGDGKLDLVLASGSVIVLLNSGDRSFQHEASNAPGTSPDALAVGDFNGDGKLDLAAAGGYSNAILILLGNSDGSFQPPVHYPAGNAPSSLAVADFNGDGNLDLAVVNPPSNTVSILIGNGDGTFKAPVSYHARLPLAHHGFQLLQLNLYIREAAGHLRPPVGIRNIEVCGKENRVLAPFHWELSVVLKESR